MYWADYFKGEAIEKIDLTGLTRVITVAVANGKVYFRHYALLFKKSGTKFPHVALEEIGPHLDMTFRRHFGASPELRAQAMKQAKLAEKKAGKNQEAGLFKEKMGRLHLKNQDLSKMATAKMKGLFTGAAERKTAAGAAAGDDDDDGYDDMFLLIVRV